MAKNKVMPEDTPASKNILTQEEVEILMSQQEEKKEKKPGRKKKVKIQFECSFAPMGDSKTNIKFKLGDKEIIKEIVMHNRLFDFPEGLSTDESRALRKALIHNGFQDITVIEGAKYNKERKVYEYSAMHPDHSRDCPFNANISLPIYDVAGNPKCDQEGKQISKQVAVVNGLVKTSDKDIYQALIKAGFKSCFAQERRE